MTMMVYVLLALDSGEVLPSIGNLLKERRCSELQRLLSSEVFETAALGG